MQIVTAAADADLIVMATRGHGATRAFFGGVAEHVARHAPVPTLLVRADATATMIPAVLRIVVPLDGSRLAEEALPIAVTLAHTLGARLHLVRVANPTTALTSTRALKQAAGADLSERGHRLELSPDKVTEEVRLGDTADQLLAILQPGDLLVMATRGGGRVRRLLGSTATALMRRAPVPVLLVRAGVGTMAPALAAAKDPGATGREARI